MAETSYAFQSGRTPVVLIHGFWHGSWCWSLVTQELAASGVASVALDLEGHGLKSCSPRTRWGRPFDPAAYAAEPSAVAGVTATSAASTLADQIRRLGGGRPCTADQAIMPALQRRFIGEIDAVSAAPTEVIEMDTAHSPFLSRPAELADVLKTIHESTPRQ